MIVTKEIKMPGKKLLSVLYMQYGSLWTWISVVGLIVCIILGITVNFRFYFLALIWLFMFLPLMVAFLYFFYGMQPLTAFNAIPHKIIFGDSQLKVRLMERDENGNEVEANENKDYIANYTSLKELKSGTDYMLAFFTKIGWLFLPLSAFSSIDEFNNALKLIRNDRQ